MSTLYAMKKVKGIIMDYRINPSKIRAVYFATTVLRQSIIPNNLAINSSGAVNATTQIAT
jgi:hypothetical protein